MKRFTNQVAIVAGGARGIGKGIAGRLAREGCKVILFDVLEKELDRTVNSFQEDQLDVQGRVMDVTDEEGLELLINRIAKTHSRLDILVNCAGIVGQSGVNIVDYPTPTFEKVVDINLKGAFLLTKYVIPPMLARNYGRILHLSSIGGKEGNPGMVGYAASKSGMIGLVKAVGKEYANTGITVNGVAPAVIATPMNLDTNPQLLDYMTAKIPMRRLGTIEETAALCCWIVSPEASFNTGFIFDLSGGRATY